MVCKPGIQTHDAILCYNDSLRNSLSTKSPGKTNLASVWRNAYRLLLTPPPAPSSYDAATSHCSSSSSSSSASRGEKERTAIFSRQLLHLYFHAQLWSFPSWMCVFAHITATMAAAVGASTTTNNKWQTTKKNNACKITFSDFTCVLRPFWPAS